MWLHSCYTHTANKNTSSELSQDMVFFKMFVLSLIFLIEAPKVNHVTARLNNRTVSYLFEQSHGKFLVWYTVFGCADVLSTLRADVEVDTHQEILLRST